jgi:hypothetical protein
MATLAQVGGETALPRIPSSAECRSCNISRHGDPQKIEAPPLDIAPEHDLF